MKAVKRTPRSQMQYIALRKRSEGLAEIMAEALDATTEMVDEQINNFIYISANVEFEHSEIEWEPACATDSEEVFAAKFLKYMDSNFDLILSAIVLVNQRDRPFDDELAPPADGKKK